MWGRFVGHQVILCWNADTLMAISHVHHVLLATLTISRKEIGKDMNFSKHHCQSFLSWRTAGLVVLSADISREWDYVDEPKSPECMCSAMWTGVTSTTGVFTWCSSPRRAQQLKKLTALFLIISAIKATFSASVMATALQAPVTWAR